MLQREQRGKPDVDCVVEGGDLHAPLVMRRCDVGSDQSWISRTPKTPVDDSCFGYTFGRWNRFTCDARLYVIDHLWLYRLTWLTARVKVADPFLSPVVKIYLPVFYFSPSSICAYCYTSTDLECVLGLILVCDWSKAWSFDSFLESHWRRALSVKPYPPSALFGWIFLLPFLSAVGRSRCPWSRMLPS